MRFDRLVLHQVGPFEDLDLTFRPGRDPALADIHLFVGANGTGKSTLLYALAQAVTTDRTPLLERFWGDGSATWVHVGQWVGATKGSKYLQTPDGERIRVRSSVGEGFGLYAAEGADRPWKRQSPATFAAFAYSGLRRVQMEPLGAIEELRGSPLDGATSFHDASDTQVLKQWIANQITKAALAHARADESAAETRRRSLARLERALSDITGWNITFTLQEDPLEVLVTANGTALDLAVLPDGLKSILSWLGDLLMRLDRLKWVDDTPVEQRPFALLLDEIEVHLHPKWQRKIVPAVQKLFPNAQVFLATHSPFVVASASDAWIYPLRLENGRAVAGEPLPSRIGHSYVDVLQEVFELPSEFDPESEAMLDEFLALRDRRLAGEPVQAELDDAAKALQVRSLELRDIVGREMRALERRLGASA